MKIKKVSSVWARSPWYCATRMALLYGTFRICVLRTSHLEPHRTSVPYFSSIFEAYRTKVPYLYYYKKGVPYQRTELPSKNWGVPYRTAILAFNYSQLWLTSKSLACKSAISIYALASTSTVFCLCIQKAGTTCEKSGIFNSNSVPTFRTCTVTKKAYPTS